MFNKVKLTSAGLLLSAFVGLNAQASELSVPSIVNTLVSQAVTVTQMELQTSVETAVAQTAHVFDFEDDATTLLTKVTIIDLETDVNNETE